MAAAVAPSLDLSSQGSFPIRLGNSILQPSEGKKFTSVRYNHKPRLNAREDVKSSISYRSRDGRTLGLSLKEGDSQYKYLGRDVNIEEDDRYVLLPRGGGKNKEMVLEKLSACTDFNLVSLTNGTDVRNMKSEYPRLPKDDLSDEQPMDGAADELFGEPADPSNPFDYRNYLGKGTAKPRPSKAEAPKEAADTVQSKARKNEPTPHSKSSKPPDNPLISQKKRKATDTAKSNPKRVKAGEEPPPKVTAADSKSNVPRVRLDRKASIKMPPFEDLGELVLEDETPVQEKPRSAMHLALTGQLGQGPISLHSAANSPAGRTASPGPTRPDHVDEDAEFELGGSSPEASQPAKRLDADDEDDADVDDLELPSVSQTRQVSSREEAVDDEDDLDKQLALAMAEEDDGGYPAVAVQHESEEESEEE